MGHQIWLYIDRPGYSVLQSISLLIISIFLATPSFTQDQLKKNDDSYGKVGVGFGLHTAGYFQGYSYAGKKKPGPTYSISADIKLGPVISLGMLMAYSQGRLFIEDATRRNYPGKQVEDLIITGRRFLISQRTLFYYFDRRDLALYSGIGIGYARIMRETDTGWYDYNAPQPDPLGVIRKFEVNRDVGRLNFQLVLLGLNTEISKNAGLNFEFGIGPPYYFNLNFYAKLTSEKNSRSPEQ